MQISPSPPVSTTPPFGGDDTDSVTQALLINRSLRGNEAEALALIESARITGPAQPLDSRLVGRILNQKV